MNNDDKKSKPVSLCFAGLVVMARSLNPIPFRTRPLNSSAPMVLCLKTRESRSLPGLQSTETRKILFTIQPKKPRPVQLAGLFAFQIPHKTPPSPQNDAHKPAKAKPSPPHTRHCATTKSRNTRTRDASTSPGPTKPHETPRRPRGETLQNR